MIYRLFTILGAGMVLVASAADAQGDPVRVTLPAGGEIVVGCAVGQAEAHTAGGDVTVHCHDAGGATPTTVAGASPTSAPATAVATHDHGGPTATALPAGGQMPQLVDWGAFDARRIPISLEAWWTQASLVPGQPTNVLADFGHVHAEARLPIGQDVSGTLNFNARLVMHGNPGTLERLRFDDDGGVRLRIPLSHTCPGGGTCSFNVPVSLNTSSMSNGWRELRMRAEVRTPDNKAFLNSGGIPLRVANGSGGSNYDRWCNNTSLIARGWYDGFGYTNPVLECTPLAPVSGTWRPRFYAQEGNGGRVIVAVDRFHAVPAVGEHPAIPQSAGWTLLDATSISRFQEVPIDTTRLANGWHSLSMIVISPDSGTSSCALPGLCQGGRNHPAGVMRVWFMVAN